MPSNLYPLGALPARFRRQRVLIVGCGDVGLRTAKVMGRNVRLLALTSSPDRIARLRAAGITPLRGNLDEAATLARLAGLTTRVLHLAPPPSTGETDPRSQALVRALARRSLPQALVYISTTGVYGDCGGAWVAETRMPAPASERARRRVDAEATLRALGRQGVRVGVLRVPGIYAADRPGGAPRERLLRGTRLLRAEDDVYVSHIHADDLARACVLALWRALPQRICHVADESSLRMGDYFDLAADVYGLPRLPRISRAQAQRELTPAMLGFLGESRRLLTARMRRELRLKLRFATVREGLAASVADQRG
ncbi:MAG: NAD(P)-dependent oxidoreductase [Comamonas sp. SCN 65-56]|uniref:NAD-dependent epimerase/dehydratase family protein n=1 Tax=Comamonas sp. SCN 65-56 TaxID=1660095 RepID=UPI00086E657B|nr:NAD-dependent epimerase/dehydratase family protein [Comamonas sp. SCN 65-56]ODS91665.1 MAG: NAD(P)-dependent oxidoreductase [Comamonas sp. SCN 65-56]